MSYFSRLFQRWFGKRLCDAVNMHANELLIKVITALQSEQGCWQRNYNLTVNNEDTPLYFYFVSWLSERFTIPPK